MSIASKIQYNHYFEPAPLDYSFEDNFKYRLISSVDELKEILKDVSSDKIVSYDCETDGLCYVENKMVGFSISFDDMSGFYVPLRHEYYEEIETKEPKTDANGNVILSKKKGNPPLMKKVKVKKYHNYESNLDVKECLDILYESLCKSKLVLMHNASFDMMMLKKEGYDVSKINIFDTMVLTYNADTNAKGMFGLKQASEHFLGRRPMKFKEVLGKEKTFKYINPVDCAYYASSDTANTYGLFKKLYPILIKEGCGNVLKMDNDLVKSFIHYYTETPLYIDKKVMNEYRNSINKRRDELELKIYESVGYPFNIRSKTHELVQALQSMGIDTGVRTEKGAMSVAKEALEGIADDYPIARDLVELSHLDKQMNSYIEKLADCPPYEDNEDIGVCRINYNLFGTASGRLASGNSAKSKSDVNNYFINLNIQNLTKPKPAIYEAVKISENVNEGILGWEFKLVDSQYMKDNPDKYYVEGLSPEINVRRAIRTKDDSELVVSLDYSAQELKLAGIVSGEPNFIKPFQEGRDVHTEMAKKLFGEDNYNKEKRKAAKVANFGLLYGGNWRVLQAVASQMGLLMTDDEAEELYNKWWNANYVLKSWKNVELDRTEREYNFTVKDLFGRPRRVKHYLCSDDVGTYNFGVRTIASHKIQGSGANIMRRLLISLFNNIFSNPKYREEVRYLSSVHDEVNYCIKKKNIVKWIDIIEKMMIFKPKSFPIPIDCSIEVGTSLGDLYPFKWNEDRTTLIPKRI